MAKKDALVFVIHRHMTVRPHYDFRLQIGDVMPSWAVPKGPTLDPTVKRLAMETTDHDMEYRHFEGVIPEGQYGAGPVMIWDEGTYTAEVEVEKGVRKEITDIDEAHRVMSEGKKKGEIKFFLNGHKLKGSFALVKTYGFGPKNSWLLIKHKDQYAKAGYDATKHDVSAVSKKTIEEIAKA